MTRIACFLVPLFALAARLRSEPELTPEAVAVFEGNGTAARVIAATRRARKAGITVGLTAAQARSILPKLIARSRDMECERAAQEALFEIAERFSPRVEDAGDGIVYLDITGMEVHFRSPAPVTEESSPRAGSPQTGRLAAGAPLSTQHSALSTAEKSLAQTAIRAAEAASLPIRVGIASSKLAARVAADLPKSPNVIPSGEELSFLAPLPLERLSPEIETATMLNRWGLHSIGELARLGEAEVASRLGETGRELHYAARGIDPRPLVPRPTPPDFREGMDLEWPIVTLEPFLFTANAALDRLMKRMESQGYSCRAITMSLRLEPDGFHERAIALPAPTRDVKTILTLIRLDLEATPPGAPVAGFTLIADPDHPRKGQLSLFGPPALSHDKLTASVAKIAAMVGTDRVGMPETVDRHLPERFGITSFDPPPPPEMRRKPRKARGLLAVRVLRPPVEIEVTTDQGPLNKANPLFNDGLLMHMQLRSVKALIPDREQKSKPLKIEGSVRVASGPWRLEEGWWTEEPVVRDYWDIELTSGGIYRIYRERTNGAWFADGIYD